MKKVNLPKLVLICLILIVILLSSCNNKKDSTITGDVLDEDNIPGVVEIPKDPEEIMKVFYQKVKADDKTEDIVIFVGENIHNLDMAMADTMILDYEGHLLNNLNKLLKEYEKANSNPELLKAFDAGIENNISNFKDPELKELLKRTIDSGYILLKGEGYIYPEVNYGEILKYSDYISAGVLNYIEIMDLETRNRFTYGEVIEIPLVDLLTRVLRTEEYLVSNVGARASNKIYNLYIDYIDGSLLGTGNPYVLAEDGSSIIKDDVLKEYKTFVINNKDSRTTVFLSEYIDILEKNNNDMDSLQVMEFYNNRHTRIKDIFRDLNL